MDWISRQYQRMDVAEMHMFQYINRISQKDIIRKEVPHIVLRSRGHRHEKVLVTALMEMSVYVRQGTGTQVDLRAWHSQILLHARKIGPSWRTEGDGRLEFDVTVSLAG